MRAGWCVDGLVLTWSSGRGKVEVVESELLEIWVEEGDLMVVV